jgi:hypothetical protein
MHEDAPRGHVAHRRSVARMTTRPVRAPARLRQVRKRGQCNSPDLSKSGLKQSSSN